MSVAGLVVIQVGSSSTVVYFVNEPYIASPVDSSVLTVQSNVAGSGSYSIVAGNDLGFFAINSATGKIGYNSRNTTSCFSCLYSSYRFCVVK